MLLCKETKQKNKSEIDIYTKIAQIERGEIVF